MIVEMVESDDLVCAIKKFFSLKQFLIKQPGPFVVIEISQNTGNLFEQFYKAKLPFEKLFSLQQFLIAHGDMSRVKMEEWDGRWRREAAEPGKGWQMVVFV